MTADHKTPETAQKSPGVPRVESLTGLRWWAAFFVFAHHMSNLAPLPIVGFLRLGISGVTFFFVLSGFVLTWSASPRLPTRGFYWRRVARIGPSHLVATALALPVFYAFAPDPADTWVNPVDLAAIALSLVLLQGWSGVRDVHFAGNPAAWTLSVEAFFYAGHPLYNRLLRRATPRIAIGLAVALIAGVVITRHYWPGATTLPAPIQYLPAFLLGMLLATAMRGGWRPRIPTPIAVALLGTGLVAAWLAGAHPHAAGAFLIRAMQLEMLAVLYAVVIVAAAARDLAGRRSVLRSRPLVALGQWSYGFYLIHATLLYGVRSVTGVIPAGWSNLAIYAALLVPSVLASWALYAWVERPAERRLRPLVGRRRDDSGADQGLDRGVHRGAEPAPAATVEV